MPQADAGVAEPAPTPHVTHPEADPDAQPAADAPMPFDGVADLDDVDAPSAGTGVFELPASGKKFPYVVGPHGELICHERGFLVWTRDVPLYICLGCRKAKKAENAGAYRHWATCYNNGKLPRTVRPPQALIDHVFAKYGLLSYREVEPMAFPGGLSLPALHRAEGWACQSRACGMASTRFEHVKAHVKTCRYQQSVLQVTVLKLFKREVPDADCPRWQACSVDPPPPPAWADGAPGGTCLVEMTKALKRDMDPRVEHDRRTLGPFLNTTNVYGHLEPVRLRDRVKLIALPADKHVAKALKLASGAYVDDTHVMLGPDQYLVTRRCLQDDGK